MPTTSTASSSTEPLAPSPGSPGGGAWPKWLALAVVLVALVYGRGLTHGFVHDDTALLENSARLSDIASLPTALTRDLFWLADDAVRPSPYWRPLVTLSYYADRHGLGGGAWAFHLTNLLWLCGLGLAALRTMPARSSTHARAFVLALVLLHPMQSEAALNITARTDLMAATLGTLAMTLGGWAGGLATLGALGCKETAIIVPVLALVWHGGRGRGWWPHALVAAIWLAVRTWLVSDWGVHSSDLPGPTLGGVLAAPASVGFYLSRLVLPTSPVAARLMPELGLAASLAGGAVALGAGAVFWTRPSSRRGLALLLLPLFPVSGLLVGQVRYAEGFLTWPLVGMALLIGAHDRLPRAALGIPLLLGLMSWVRVPDWASESALWTQARADYPDDPLVSGKFARAVHQDQPEAATRAAEHALAAATRPRDQRELHALLANIALAHGRDETARPHLRLAADPNDPERAWALAARCVHDAGRPPREYAHAPWTLEQVCAAATTREPGDPDVWNGAGIAAAVGGNLPLAHARFAEAVRLAPDRPELRANLERADKQLRDAP